MYLSFAHPRTIIQSWAPSSLFWPFMRISMALPSKTGAGNQTLTISRKGSRGDNLYRCIWAKFSNILDAAFKKFQRPYVSASYNLLIFHLFVIIKRRKRFIPTTFELEAVASLLVTIICPQWLTSADWHQLLMSSFWIVWNAYPHITRSITMEIPSVLYWLNVLS